MRIRTVQKIKGPIQSGKTFMLHSLARGYALSGLKVAVVYPCMEIARAWRDRSDIPGVDFLDYTSAILHEGARGKYDAVLLDDCEKMPWPLEGDPVTRTVGMYKASNDPLVVVGVYSV